MYNCEAIALLNLGYYLRTTLTFLGFIYVSGQIPYTADNKPLPESASIQDYAEQAIQNVSAILEASNSSLKHIVKANIFLTDMNAQFGEFNKVYAKYFNEHKPARSCVAVKELPLGVPLEIEAIAVEKDATKLWLEMNIEIPPLLRRNELPCCYQELSE